MPALKPETRRFLVFCLVGGSGVFVNLAVFWVIRHLLLPPGELADNAAVVGGWVVSVATNFTLNHLFTFRDATRGSEVSVLRRLATYYASTLVALAVQWLVFRGGRLAIAAMPLDASSLGGLWAHVITLEAGLANLAGIAVATIVNFWFSKKLVFKK